MINNSVLENLGVFFIYAKPSLASQNNAGLAGSMSYNTTDYNSLILINSAPELKNNQCEICNQYVSLSSVPGNASAVLAYSMPDPMNPTSDNSKLIHVRCAEKFYADYMKRAVSATTQSCLINAPPRVLDYNRDQGTTVINLDAVRWIYSTHGAPQGSINY
tara:strand:- start:2267 stop:2749 length:483 start_codon:yes stop_codon:yes gene_type:complete